jgi:hypothetical protein
MFVSRNEKTFKYRDLWPFVVLKHPDDRYFVAIGCFEYGWKAAEWLQNEELGDFPLFISIETLAELHEFRTEEECMQFVRGWWAGYDSDKDYL